MENSQKILILKRIKTVDIDEKDRLDSKNN